MTLDSFKRAAQESQPDAPEELISVGNKKPPRT